MLLSLLSTNERREPKIVQSVLKASGSIPVTYLDASQYYVCGRIDNLKVPLQASHQHEMYTQVCAAR